MTQRDNRAKEESLASLLGKVFLSERGQPFIHVATRKMVQRTGHTMRGIGIWDIRPKETETRDSDRKPRLRMNMAMAYPIAKRGVTK